RSCALRGVHLRPANTESRERVRKSQNRKRLDQPAGGALSGSSSRLLRIEPVKGLRLDGARQMLEGSQPSLWPQTTSREFGRRLPQSATYRAIAAHSACSKHLSNADHRSHASVDQPTAVVWRRRSEDLFE